MKSSALTVQFNRFNQMLMLLFLLALPLTGANAAPGCCSHHGGVNGCNMSTGHQSCKDGTVSPSCPCNGASKALPATKSKSTPMTKSTTAPATKAQQPTKKPPAKVKKAAVPAPVPVKTTGCCSRHGGVAQCNKSTGFQQCKDGTASTTCKCN